MIKLQFITRLHVLQTNSRFIQPPGDTHNHWHDVSINMRIQGKSTTWDTQCVPINMRIQGLSIHLEIHNHRHGVPINMRIQGISNHLGIHNHWHGVSINMRIQGLSNHLEIHNHSHGVPINLRIQCYLTTWRYTTTDMVYQ